MHFGSKCFPSFAKKGSLSAAHNRLVVYEDVDEPEHAMSDTKVGFVLLSSPSSSLFAGSWGRCVARAVEIDLHVFFFCSRFI